MINIVSQQAVFKQKTEQAALVGFVTIKSTVKVKWIAEC